MFNSTYIYKSADSRSAWNDYQQFFKHMMQQLVPAFNRPTIFLAHTRSDFDEAAGRYRTSVPVKGALRDVGVEAFFSTIVSSKVLSLKELKPYKSELLNISQDEEFVEQKHVFQTRLTKETLGENIRSPMGFFSPNQCFMDNDAQLLLDHLKLKYEGK